MVIGLLPERYFDPADRRGMNQRAIPPCPPLGGGGPQALPKGERQGRRLEGVLIGGVRESLKTRPVPHGEKAAKKVITT